MTNANAKPSRRFYDLDALRAVAMLLGVVLHASLFVLPEPQSLWPIHDPNARGDPFYRVVVDSIHGFRMPVFFMLSGFFTALVWQRRGLTYLMQQRLKRIGIPFLVACFTIIPISVWLLQLLSGGEEPYNFPLWVLPIVWLFGTLGHLWFLWYLLLLAGCFFLAARMGIQFLHPVAWWLAIPGSMLVSLVMIEPYYGPDTALTVIPVPALFVHYACFFFFGTFFYRHGIVVRRWWTVALVPAALAFWVGYSLLQEYLAPFGGDSEAAGVDFMFRNNLTLLGALFEAAFAWLMVFGLMGLFRWTASRKSFTVRYLSDSTYWMYLLHLPLVIIGQQIVIGGNIHYHFKFLLVCVSVTLILLVTYQYGVRYSIIGRTLNGPRTRRQPEPRAQPEPEPVPGG